MPGVDFEILRTEITMREVLDQLGFVASRRFGSQLRGPCPIHHSTSRRSRSFSVNLDTARFYCHKCHRWGNQLELWVAVHDLTIYEVAVDLCGALGREVPWLRRW